MRRSLVPLVLLVLAGCGTSAPPQSAPPQPATAPQLPAFSLDAPVPLDLDLDQTISRIAFGSCLGHDAPMPILDAMRAADPDLTLLIGDNVYADTDDMTEMAAAYAMLSADSRFAALRQAAPLLGTWDDHDYGKNDAGAEFEAKDQAQDVFARFFAPPRTSRVWTGEGVYDRYTFGPAGRRVQVILLDTRHFRSPLDTCPDRDECRYRPTDDTGRTMLGDAQWEWLEGALREPAEVRLLASSIQFAAQDHGWERWNTMPHERQRLLDLIGETQAEGVVILSGDRHSADLSVLPPSATGLRYPLYDITSSSLNKAFRTEGAEPNRWRVSSETAPYYPENFGLIEIDWTEPEPSVRLTVRDLDGAVVMEEAVALTGLGVRR
jgi:alkaline phosphatase D